MKILNLKLKARQNECVLHVLTLFLDYFHFEGNCSADNRGAVAGNGFDHPTRSISVMKLNFEVAGKCMGIIRMHRELHEKSTLSSA